MNSCPICENSPNEAIFTSKRQYFFCSECWFIYLDPKAHLAPTEEQAVYDLHDNELRSASYFAYHRKLSHIILHDQAGRFGLDFGCGPAPLLAQQIRAGGKVMQNYDLYYHPKSELLSQRFDFVVLSEVFEHLAAPNAAILQLKSLLAPRGCMYLRTQRLISPQRFISWRYKDDPTHLSFHSLTSLMVLAKKHQLKLTVLSQDIVKLCQM